ncbi:hypothetical protein LPTSP3_g35630 [Leptospira kobayashii]|uniref:Uncharacterized protein n=1 Tax=Leptospira kobayashii TaxID=1917830 RepID=A0ABN6KH90_9LEPT|nr:hypothetical protein [Leptospira kobayashii]BDA80633.1 hypothetical protein LPTSP3_g35630 [Leptospira kobayashii]
MLSYDSKNYETSPSFPPVTQLSKKLEIFTNNLLQGMQEKKEEESTWAVISLQGEILAKGSYAFPMENSDLLFREG